MKKLGICAAAVAAALSTNVSAVNLATDGVGEVAIAPYYTTRDGWSTLINLTNTRAVPVVVKVRIHEGLNSRDVLDFNVALSANDVFTALMKEADDGSGAVIDIVDEDTCTVPNNIKIVKASALGYSGDDDKGFSNLDGGPTDIDRMREGYIEFIVMGATEGDDEFGFPVGFAIENHDCAAVEQAFRKVNILDTAREFGEPINALKFNFRLINPSKAMEAGALATTWANFFNPAGAEDGAVLPGANNACTINRGAERDGAEWDPTGADAPASCLNLITAQEPFDFLEPSLNDAFPPVGNFYDDASNALVSVTGPAVVNAAVLPQNRGVDALSATIQRATVINEWSLNATTGSDTSWIVTFPTKGFYVDKGLGRQFAIITGDRDEADLGAVPYPPFAEAFIGGQSCNEVTFTAFDRAENSAIQTGGTIVSPAPTAPVDELCREANVVTFSANGGDSAGVLATANPVTVDLSQLVNNFDADAGWMELNLAAEGSAQNPATLGGWNGLPAIGFMIKHRDLGDPTLNFASSIEHGYTRVSNP